MRNIEITSGNSSAENGIGRICYETLFGVLLFISIYMSYASLFGLSYYVRWILILGAAIVLVSSIFSGHRGFLPLAMVGVSLIFAILMLAGNQLLGDGLKVTANKILEIFGKAGRISFRQFSLEGASADTEIYGACFLAFCAAALAFLCEVAVKHRKRLLAVLMALPVFVIQALLKGEPDLFFVLLMVVMLVLLCCSSFLKEIPYKMLIFTAGASVPVLFLLLLGIYILIPQSGYAKQGFVQDVKAAVQNTVSDLKYEKGKPNSFTQGDFLRLSHLELWEEPALEVTMDHPQSYYLRGFVGSRYTSSRWEALDGETAYENYSLYYWLHQDGFSSLNQLALLERQGSENGKPEEVTVDIQNVNANSKYLYTPYELSQLPESLSETKTVDDDSFLSEELSGQRSYTYSAVKNMTGRYPEALAAIEEMASQNRELIEAYKKDEMNYREKVYEDYLEIPANVNGLLAGILGGKFGDENPHVDCQEAVEFIRDYLKNNITYDTGAVGISRGEDFLTDVLQTTKKGYSVHFATAAAMMFRYMGIPSRYVEGYLITPDDVQGVKNNETIEVMGMNGHAWVEIYQDGIGWIPMEMTPSYYGIMDQAQIPGSSVVAASGEGSEGGNEGGQSLDEVKPPDVADTLEKSTMDILFMVRLICGIFVGILAAGILGTLLFLYIRRRRTLSRRELMFSNADKGQAICHMFVYIEQIFGAAGIEKTGASVRTYAGSIREKWTGAYAKRYQLILEISQKAAFSTHVMSSQEWKDVSEYKDMVLMKLLDGQKWRQKMKLKYIYCLY